MLAITKEAYAIMLVHCQAQYPLEACGFLGGTAGLAYSVTLVENLLRSPVAYEMEPRQQIEAMLSLENNGLELLAAFHSHPHGPPSPSVTDVAQAYYPDLPQIIISLQTRTAPSVRSFLLAPDHIHEQFLQRV